MIVTSSNVVGWSYDESIYERIDRGRWRDGWRYRQSKRWRDKQRIKGEIYRGKNGETEGRTIRCSDKTFGDITSLGIQRLGQNVRGDKTSGGTKRLEGQMSLRTKRPEGQNIQRHAYKKTSGGTDVWRHNILSLFSINSTYIFFLTQGIIYSLSTMHLYNVIVRMLTVLIDTKDP